MNELAIGPELLVAAQAPYFRSYRLSVSFYAKSSTAIWIFLAMCNLHLAAYLGFPQFHLPYIVSATILRTRKSYQGTCLGTH